MALGLVLVGIATGSLAAASVVVLGGGIGLAVLAYAGGGVAGLLVAVTSVLVPRHQIAVAMSRDHG